AKAHARVRCDAVDRAAEPVRPRRSGVVAFALVGREAASADVRRPRPGDTAPAAPASLPQAEHGSRSTRRVDGDELRRRLCRGEPGAGEGPGGEEGGYAHPRMVAVPATPPPFVARVEHVTAADLRY